jgi:alkylation response protein AidB-like acyl-CoA dehydrogenase
MTEAQLPPSLLKPTMTDEQQEWLGRVDKIAPLLAEHRKEAEQNRVVPPVVYEALSDAGFTRLWVSHEFGGEQVSLLTGVTVIEALARIDASVAWLVSVQAAVGHLSSYLSEQVARKLYKENTGLVIGGVRPTGTAEIVDGGYVLSGEWAFASGFAHAGWLFCAAMATENGEVVQTPAGPKMVMLFVPKDQAQPRDTWHTLGLRATGSQHFKVDQAFVPEDFAINQTELLSPPPDRPSRAYSIGYTSFVPYADAPVALGVAQDALDSIRPLLASKVAFGATATLAKSQVVLDKLARAEMLVHTARLLMWDIARQGMRHGATGGDSLTALLRLTTTTVAEKATAAVDILYDISGTTSLYTDSRLERCFRDVHSANKHISMSATHYEMVGQYLLGGPLLWRR